MYSFTIACTIITGKGKPLTDARNRYLMLGYILVHIPSNAISILEWRLSFNALLGKLVLPSASTLSNSCQREYSLRVDAID